MIKYTFIILTLFILFSINMYSLDENIEQYKYKSSVSPAIYNDLVGLSYNTKILFKDGFLINVFAYYGLNINYIFLGLFKYPQLQSYNLGINFYKDKNSLTIGVKDLKSELLHIARSSVVYLNYSYNYYDFFINTTTIQAGMDFLLLKDSILYRNPNYNISVININTLNYLNNSIVKMSLILNIQYSLNFKDFNGHAFGIALYSPISILSDIISISPFLEYRIGFGSLEDFLLNNMYSPVNGFFDFAKTLLVGLSLEFKYYFLRDTVSFLSDVFLSIGIKGYYDFDKYFKESINGMVFIGLGQKINSFRLALEIGYTIDNRLIVAGIRFKFEGGKITKEIK